MSNFYYSFNQYLQKTFGERVHRISLNAGCGCPNIDGTKSSEGCIFCNNKAFSRYANVDEFSLQEQIMQSMEHFRSRMGVQKFIAYFQNFSSTYGEVTFLRKRYNLIRDFPDIVGLCVSTRPDCIDEEKLDLLSEFAKDYKVYIEYGLQSIHDTTLQSINRNHTFGDFREAVFATAKRKDIHIAAHVILGLPDEKKEDMLITARSLAHLPLWGIKFHSLHVVKETKLAEVHKAGKVSLLDEDAYIDILISFLEYIPKEWVILRLVSDADKDLLIAPRWINEKQRILRRIEKECEVRGAFQGRLHESIDYTYR